MVPPLVHKDSSSPLFTNTLYCLKFLLLLLVYDGYRVLAHSFWSCISLILVKFSSSFSLLDILVSHFWNYLFILSTFFIGILVLFLMVCSLYLLQIMFLFAKYFNNVFSQFFTCLLTLFMVFCIEKIYLILIILSQSNLDIKLCTLYSSFK